MALESGVISTKSPGTKTMNVTQNSHWWPRSKKKIWTQIHNHIQKIMEGDISLTQTPLPLSQPQQANQKHQRILKRVGKYSIQRWGWRGYHFISLLIEEDKITSSQWRYSNNCNFQQHHTRSHTTLDGFTRDEISMSANSVACPTESNPSTMRYFFMLPHRLFVTFFWSSHICGSTILFMSLDPVVSLLLCGLISIGYQR